MARDGEWAIRPDIHLPLCHQRTSPFLAESKSLQKVRARPSQRRGLLCAVLWKAPDNSSICLSASNKQTKRLQSFIVFVLASISHYNFMLTGAGLLSVCSARKQTDERRPKEHKRQSWSPFQKTRPRCTSDQPCSFVSSTASLFVCSEVEERKEFIVRRQRFSATRRALPVSAEMFLPGTGKTGNLRHHLDGKDKEGLLVREALKKLFFLGIIPKPMDPSPP